MNRRALLGTLGTAGVLATAGCSGVGGTERLSDPVVRDEPSSGKTLLFRSVVKNPDISTWMGVF
jgi:hypothetical protein